MRRLILYFIRIRQIKEVGHLEMKLSMVIRFTRSEQTSLLGIHNVSGLVIVWDDADIQLFISWYLP